MGYFNYSGAWLAHTNQSNGVRYHRGTSASETLNGTSGADEFDGGGGWDTFVGGAGDDFYWLGDGRHPVIEKAGEGIDTVKAWVSVNLHQNVENLTIFGNGSYAAGNDLNNIIVGEGGSQYIYGGRGEDVLVGGGEKDTFIVKMGEGNEVIQDFQPGTDVLRLIGSSNLTSIEAVKANMTQQGADVVLNHGGTMLLLKNTQIGQFQARDFQLPVNYGALGTPKFADEFNTMQIGDNSVWKSNFGYGGNTHIDSYTLKNNGELQIYTNPDFKGTGSSNLGLNPYSLNNGVLTISAQPVNDWQSSQMWGYKYSSGMLISNQTYLYGYFEIRAELPQGQGLWPAFWLIGPENKEIDILEVIGSSPQVPDHALHWPGGNHLSTHNFQTDTSGYHTYGALWTPTEIIFTIDGTESWRVANPVMNQPMHMIVNLAVGGNWAGPPNSSTPWPAKMNIDYVRVYDLPGTSPTPTTPTPPPPTTGTGGTGTGGGQVLTASGPHSTLTGGAGNDTLNASQGYDVLTGGGGGDVFAFAKEPWAPITIKDFAVGADKLDLSAMLKAAGYTGSDPVADKYISFKAGSGGTEVFFDRDGAGTGQQWPNRIINLEGVSTSGLTWAQLTGASGGGTTTPTPPPPPPPTTGTGGTSTGGQVLTSSGSYSTLTGGAGADTLNAGQGYDVLTGGGGADVFAFAKEPWAPVTVKDFVVGTDKLDLSAMFKAAGYSGSDPVADKYLSFKAGANGSTEVFFDRDGTAAGQQWPNRVITLEGVNVNGLTWSQLSGGATGGTTTPTPPPPPPPTTGTGGTTGQVLTSSGAYSTLTGGAGADTLNAGQGFDVLTGGGGADVFAFAKEPWAPITVKDFVVGTDKLDLSAMFKAAGYTGSDPVGAKYLSFKAGANGSTEVFFDRDGPATGQMWPNRIITLEGVNVNGLTWSQLSAGGSTGGTTTPTPPPPTTGGTGTAGQVLTAATSYSKLTGGAGNDTLNASDGADTLTGGAGADIFNFAQKPWAPTEIEDLELGHDKVDVRGILKGFGYTGSDPIRDKVISFADDGMGGSRMLFDRDGAATGQIWPDYAIHIDNHSPSTLLSNTGWLIV